MVFFLGGADAEMVAIRQILETEGVAFCDKGLGWGLLLLPMLRKYRLLQLKAVFRYWLNCQKILNFLKEQLKLTITIKIPIVRQAFCRF